MVSKFDEVVTSTIIDIILCSHEIFFSTFRMYDFKTLNSRKNTDARKQEWILELLKNTMLSKKLSTSYRVLLKL